jgi:hypothetical protein
MAEKAKPGKVLRIGILQDGKIVQERLIKAGESVTLGESPKSTFVVPKTHLPSAEFAVFQWTAKGYVLRFTEQMKGKIDRVGTANATYALNALREDPAVPRANGVFSYPLTDSDRGKIGVDQVTVLFQFVAPQAGGATSPTQAMDFRPRFLQDDDGVFLGFLMIWGVMASFLGLWVAFTDPPELTLDSIDVRTIIPPKIEEPPVVEEQAPAEEEAAPEKETSGETEAADPGAARDAQVAREKAATEAASRLLAGLIGTTGESASGDVVEDVLGQSGLGDVNAALAEAGSITGDAGAAGYKSGQGSKGDAASIDGIGSLGGQGAAGVSGDVTKLLKPKVTTGSGNVSELSGDQNEVSKVVKMNAGQLRYCYETQLKTNPGLGGRVEIGWTVEASGTTSNVYTISNETGDATLAKCIEGKIRRWRFNGAEGDVSWPFVFTAKE